ncbi:uncharacterized protein LOC115879656 isoform X3 [Sitophilus oryzae]|nr:uncharacterized protein LOC115879656 isoform X3 [Sitophilus oryzae]
MFISKGKMVNMMFGADAPKLTRLITEELKKEQLAQDGQSTDRTPMEVTDLSDEERVRYDAAESIQREIREKEERKIAKELLERRTKECDTILTNVPNFGIVLIFPSAKDKYKEVLHDILDEAGLVLQQTEKVQLDENILQELCYFAKYDEEFPEDYLEDLLAEKSAFLLLKVAARADIEDIDDAILTMVYGSSKHPPGDPECVARSLIFVEEDIEGQPVKEKNGIWVPPTPEVRATALKLFFPKVTQEFHIPDPEPEPEHIAVVFPLNKKDEVFPIMHQFPNEIMKRGFFSTENAEDTRLIAKSLKQLEKLEAANRTFSEKLVLQVSKRKSECIFAFAQLDPIYMSPNVKEGKAECERFFPEGYEDEIEEDDEEEKEMEDVIDEAPTAEENLGEGVEDEEIEGKEISGEVISGENIEQSESEIDQGENVGESPKVDEGPKIEEVPKADQADQGDPVVDPPIQNEEPPMPPIEEQAAT